MSSTVEPRLALKESAITYILWLCSLLAIDQTTKFWVRSHMSPGEFRILIPNILELRYVENTGIAFGLLQGMGVWLAPIAVIVTAVATFAYFKAPPHDRLFRTAMILISAGAMGNFIDRAFLQGRVTDFIDLQIIHVFNLADVCITTAVATLILRGIAEEVKAIRKKTDKTTPPHDQLSAPVNPQENPGELPTHHPEKESTTPQEPPNSP